MALAIQCMIVNMVSKLGTFFSDYTWVVWCNGCAIALVRDDDCTLLAWWLDVLRGWGRTSSWTSRACQHDCNDWRSLLDNYSVPQSNRRPRGCWRLSVAWVSHPVTT